MEPVLVLVASVALVVGVLITVAITSILGKRKIRSAESAAKEIVEAARHQARAIQKDGENKAREQALALKASLDEQEKKQTRELNHQRRELEKRTDALQRQEQALKEQREAVRRKEGLLSEREQKADVREEELARASDEHRRKLEEIAGLTAEQARDRLIEEMAEAAREAGQARIREVEEETRRLADQNARLVLAQAMHRLAPGLPPESTVTIVRLPSDELKGRIIGREGRNIRAFEHASGVDILIDETPGVIMLSSHNPLRREIAHRSILKLVEDGRIHPGRIEETVQETRDGIDKIILEIGKDAAFNLEVHDLPDPLLHLLGRLKFRVVQGQNLLELSIEAAQAGHYAAVCLEHPAETVKLAGLLHNIGYVGEGYEEKHPYLLGAELAQRYGQTPAVVRAIQSLHSSFSLTDIDHYLLHAARNLVLARPGARKEGFEKFVERLSRLEELAMGHKGVQEAVAFRAGDELMVLVKPGELGDADCLHLAHQLAREIREQVHPPNKVKVNVVRAVRSVAYAT